ncbi:DUF5701 family protein [Nocardioides sambongensis]|uniref:DUF5701 family protein n=1 Tax=Nocardioides sambongensis TaxID=2589074 RepID=UPI00112729C0|nr:DUF5701 family protein [Nocardioides sambongensis]
MTTSHPITAQLDVLLSLGLAELSGRDATWLRAAARDAVAAAGPATPGGVLAVHPDLVPASRLTPLLQRAGRPGFVVVDMTDLDEFVAVPGVDVPDRALYLVTDVDRGDDLRNRSPEEAEPVLAERGRTPLTVNEGISWLLQEPDRLAPDHCFMCIGSRKPKTPTTKGYDARTPAIWISNGTGRDGRERKDAPKVGWCWWRNRHTWLGFASATGRV